MPRSHDEYITDRDYIVGMFHRADIEFTRLHNGDIEMPEDEGPYAVVFRFRADGSLLSVKATEE